jgi:hypothetical protein
VSDMPYMYALYECLPHIRHGHTYKQDNISSPKTPPCASFASRLLNLVFCRERLQFSKVLFFLFPFFPKDLGAMPPWYQCWNLPGPLTLCEFFYLFYFSGFTCDTRRNTGSWYLRWNLRGPLTCEIFFFQDLGAFHTGSLVSALESFWATDL